ncbi:hypothetical protein KY332_00545 [Candidatus Woesearchaeota archaeon]|nr:hypothetical protein [Candidatus Woesearchaeota archaeon]
MDKHKKKLLLIFILVGVSLLILTIKMFSFFGEMRLASSVIDETINNLDYVSSVKLHVTTTTSIAGETLSSESLGKFDLSNNLAQIDSIGRTSEGDEFTSTLYQDKENTYQTFDGVWEVKKREDPAEFKFYVMVAELKEVKRTIPSIETSILDDLDMFLIKVKMNELIALQIVKDMFKNSITVRGTNQILDESYYAIKKAETSWHIDTEEYLILLKAREIQAEIAGSPLIIRTETTFYDYDVPVNIILPNIAQ